MLKFYDLVADDEKRVEHAGGWRNVYFLTDGKSMVGEWTHPSEEEARRMAKISIEEWPPDFFLSNEDHAKIGVPPYTYRNSDISHFIPMPVGDA